MAVRAVLFAVRGVLAKGRLPGAMGEGMGRLYLGLTIRMLRGCPGILIGRGRRFAACFWHVALGVLGEVVRRGERGTEGKVNLAGEDCLNFRPACDEDRTF